MPRYSSNPGWPTDAARGQRSLRRFVLLSLLAHGMALMLWPHFRPFSTVDRNRLPLSIHWRPLAPPAAHQPSIQHDSTPAPGSGEPRHARPRQPASPAVATSSPIQAVPPTARQPDAHDMIERGKAEIDTASRRRMLDPMFAPPAPHRPAATPLERATARPEATTEMIRDDILRHTNADGRSYCLQKPPDAATRDGPVPITLVPMLCP
jgi:hypothetical protein